MPVARGDVPYINDIQATLNDAVRRAAEATDVTQVDVTDVSQGHDACQPIGTRWVEPALSGTNPVVVHPNALGEQAMADGPPTSSARSHRASRSGPRTLRSPSTPDRRRPGRPSQQRDVQHRQDDADHQRRQGLDVPDPLAGSGERRGGRPGGDVGPRQRLVDRGEKNSRTSRSSVSSSARASSTTVTAA